MTKKKISPSLGKPWHTINTSKPKCFREKFEGGNKIKPTFKRGTFWAARAEKMQQNQSFNGAPSKIMDDYRRCIWNPMIESRVRLGFLMK